MKTRKNITICPIVWAELKKQAQKMGRSAASLNEEAVRKYLAEVKK